MDKHIICNIQQQPNLYNNLHVILQAINCQINSHFCNHIKCPELVSIINHIRNCEEASDCAFPKCVQTITHMKHYLNCNKKACVCFKFGTKAPENGLFLMTRQILLRNQFLIWRRKFKPFRPHLLSILSNYITNLTDASYKKPIYEELKNFDDQNFEKARGMSTYLTNFSRNVNSIMSKTLIKHVQSTNPDLTFQDCLEKIDENSNLIKIYNYLKTYSTDVLHDKIKLLESGPIEEQKFVPKVEPVLLTIAKKELKVEDIKKEPSPCQSVASSPPPSPEPEPEPIWSAEEIRDLFMPLHRRLCREKEFEIFLKPVDWKSLDIPDYPRIITRPIDLSTIEAKLEAVTEYQDPWQPINDYWLMFDNAWTYNKKSSRVYKMCSNAARLFGELADELMRSIGLCCGRQYVYEPQVLICCTPNMCMVTRDAGYYALDNRDTEVATGTDEAAGVTRPVPELTSDKYVCCDKCYQDSDNSDSVQLMVSELTSTLVSVPKALMTKLKNNVKEPEEFTECRRCRRRWHKVCAHHVDEVWPGGFFCPGCETHRACPRPTNVLCSARLPECALSRHIEGRIDSWIAEHTSVEDVHIAKVVIRVLSDCPKQVDIKPEMRRVFVETGEMPEAIPYRLKAIFAFQQQGPGCQDDYGEQGEICLFGMHCHEYGPDCPGANARRIYLAYLDSVQYFEPAELRTEFYHRLLTAYLEYCRNAGFVWAHIWACPPGDGDDYIFHMHPTSQKVPKPKRLQDWYIAMLDRAIQEGVIVDYCDIFSFSYNSQLTSLAEVPYFEGDYWPTIMEDLLKEDADAAAATAALATATNGLAIPLVTSDDTSPHNRDGTNDHEIVVVNNGVGGAITKKRKHKKLSNGNSSGPHQSKRRRHSAPTDQTVGDTPAANGNGNDTMKRLFELMEKRKENFFVVRLLDSVSAASTAVINSEDGDSVTTAVAIGADLMDGRDKFLCLSRDKHLEFSSWRRARFATLVLCYELHLEARHGVICSCNRCGMLLLEPTAVRFECARCHEYEVCESCASLPGVHRHPLHRVEVAAAVLPSTSPTLAVANNTVVDDTVAPGSASVTQTGLSTTSSNSESGAVAVVSSSSLTKTNAAPGGRAVIDDATRLRNLVLAAGMLEHALRCRDACCRTPNCPIWRGFVTHLRTCTNGNSTTANSGGQGPVTRSCRTCTRLAPLVAFHHKKYGNAGGHGNGYSATGLPVINSNNQQARLWQLQSERRRMQSATVAMAQASSVTTSGAGVVRSVHGSHLQSQQHQQQHPTSIMQQQHPTSIMQQQHPTSIIQQQQHPQQPIITGNNSSQGDVANYQRDLMAIRSYLARLRDSGVSSQDISRTFSQFLASEPRYLHVWRRNQSEMQQRQHQQKHIGTVASANPNAVMSAEPPGSQHQYQQHQYQQHQPHHGNNYRFIQRPPPPTATVLNGNQSQYYMVQGRPPQLGHGYIATVANSVGSVPPNFSTSPRFSSYQTAGHPGYGPVFNPTQPPPSLGQSPQTPQPVYYHQSVATSPVSTVPLNTHFHSHNTPS